MESTVTQLPIHDRLWTWFELHKKESLRVGAVIVVVGVAIGFYFWQRNETRDKANRALSRVLTAGMTTDEQFVPPEALLKIAADYRKTEAGGRALLLAASGLFAQGKYAEARTQFERYRREYAESAFNDQALLGMAACLDAQGKTSQAITAYNDIIQHYSTENVAVQAKMSLAWLQEKQGKVEQARDLYIDLSRGQFGSISSEAGIHLEALFAKHPELFPARSAPTNAPARVPLNP
jgi:predicted negative regulator of RcsB-dependent stress response